MATTIKFKGNLEIFDKNLADLVRGKVNNKENEVLKNISWLTLFPIVDGNILCIIFFRSSQALNVLQNLRQNSGKKTYLLKLMQWESCHLH